MSIIGLKSKFLTSRIAINSPNFIIINCIRIALHLFELLKLFLSASDDYFKCIHDNQISTLFSSSPALAIYFAFFHFLVGCLVIVFDEKYKHMEPLCDKLIALLCSYKITFKSQMPLRFSIGFDIYSPVKHSSINGMKLHNNFRKSSKSIKEIT